VKHHPQVTTYRTLCAAVLLLFNAMFVHAATLSSTSFDHQYNGDVFPVPNYTEGGSFATPATSDGNALTYQSDAISQTHFFVSNDWAPVASKGFTFEMRLKIDTDGGPQSNYGAIAIDIGNSGTNDEIVLSVGSSSVSVFNGAPIDTNTNTDGFHTFRIAQPANSTEFLIWRDGVQIADLSTGIFSDPPTLYWGDGSGVNYGGPTIHVDYARWDDTGAYAPPVPEPSSAILGLIAFGSCALVAYRCHP
jgi:hypothetical protein